MCVHPETIEDYSSGDVICAKCGLVMDKIFLDSSSTNKEIEDNSLSSVKTKERRVKNLRQETSDFLISMNIHLSFCEKILDNLKTLLARFTHYPFPLVVASACFVALSSTECPITLMRLENKICVNKRDKRNLFKMIGSFHQPFLYPNLSNHIANSMLQGLQLSFYHIETIKKNIDHLKCEYCTFSPLTVVTAHSFLYFKSEKLPISLATICFHVGVSKTAIYSYINEKRHKCVKLWSHVYE